MGEVLQMSEILTVQAGHDDVLYEATKLIHYKIINIEDDE